MSVNVTKHGTVRYVRYGFLLLCYGNFVPAHRFKDIRLDLKIRDRESLKVIGIDTDRSAAYDFLLTFHNNQEPISYRFRD